MFTNIRHVPLGDASSIGYNRHRRSFFMANI